MVVEEEEEEKKKEKEEEEGAVVVVVVVKEEEEEVVLKMEEGERGHCFDPATPVSLLLHFLSFPHPSPPLPSPSRVTYQSLRSSIIDLVLATDMSKHFEHVSKFSNTVPLLQVIRANHT